jgi:7-cyano-7-deazaguanine synthase
MKIVIAVSGGMDSTTLLADVLHQGYEVHCCVFTYGSKHNYYENGAALDVINYYQNAGYPLSHHFFDLSNVFAPFNSDLLKTGGEIPEGHYNDSNMKSTVVPGRNLIFASILAGLAESVGAKYIMLGVHAGDHAIYPDCRFEFMESLKKTIELSTDGKVTVRYPYINMDKSGILAKGYSLPVPVPYSLTRTCYKDQPLSCGKCGSCVERLEAFENMEIKDPVQYEQ